MTILHWRSALNRTLEHHVRVQSKPEASKHLDAFTSSRDWSFLTLTYSEPSSPIYQLPQNQVSCLHPLSSPSHQEWQSKMEKHSSRRYSSKCPGGKERVSTAQKQTSPSLNKSLGWSKILSQDVHGQGQMTKYHTTYQRERRKQQKMETNLKIILQVIDVYLKREEKISKHKISC